MEKEFAEALKHIMYPYRHENETTKEFATRKFRQQRIRHKLKKHRIVVPTTYGVN